MKQVLLSFILLGSTVFAQNERYSVGAQFGYALSDFTYIHTDNIDLNSPYSTELQSTFNAGIEVRRQMGERGLFIQTGLKWIGYGWKHTHNFSEWNGSAFEDMTNVNSTKLTYFSVPLAMTYKFPEVLSGVTLSAGPQFSFFSYRKWKQNGEVLSSTWSMSDFAVGAYFSVGYEHNLGARWILGGEVFSNLLSNEVYNFGIGVSLRYIFKRISFPE